MRARQLVPPTKEPVPLAVAKKHLYISHTADDSTVKRCIESARAYIEAETGIQLMPATWEAYIDGFPKKFIVMPKYPLLDVEDNIGISYLIGDEWTILDTSEIRVDPYGPYLRISCRGTWPKADDGINTVRLLFKMGYEDEDKIPADLRGALLLLVGHYYEHRDASVIGNSNPLALGVDDIISRYCAKEYI